MSGEEDDAETVEAVFAQARDAEAVGEEMLVDEGWKAVEVEPTVVETHRNGNGHPDANGVEPGVELVMGNGRHANGNGAGRAAVPVNGNGHHANGNGAGHAAVPVNGHGHHANGNGCHANGNENGHRDEAPEPQRSLFSWAEFMAEEPVKPKSRSRKPKPASTSLFDWALTLEREEELVGAGR